MYRTTTQYPLLMVLPGKIHTGLPPLPRPSSALHLHRAVTVRIVATPAGALVIQPVSQIGATDGGDQPALRALLSAKHQWKSTSHNLFYFCAE